MIKKITDPISALTHLIGVILAIPLTVILVTQAARHATIWHVLSFLIFGVALILLYTASTVYHMLPISKKARDVLRRIDHMMIFVLIAGTYTPVCLVPLRGPWGYSLLALVWAAAIGGILLKALWLDAPRWLSTGIYVGMGWMVLIAFCPLVRSMSATAVAMLALGGLTYTLGAVIYAAKWPHFHFRLFGFHELFHLFVMGGSAFHILFMFRYVLAV